MQEYLLNQASRRTAMITLASLILLLSACADDLEPAPIAPRYSNLPLNTPAPNSSRALPDTAMQCVPYARLISGINLRGDAFTWWSGANGLYPRGAAPAPGAVLVLAQTGRLRSGHVAVVRQIVSAREILVDHANWIPGQVINGQSVYDASPANDWTMPRFYNAEAGVYGNIYPAYGFIYNVAAVPAPIASMSGAPLQNGQGWVPPQ